MKRKRLAVLLAFGLLAAVFVATSAPASAETDSQNLYVHCGFTPGWGNQNSASAFTSDVSITAPDTVNRNETFQVLVDLNDNANGPLGVAAGVLDFSSDVNVSGAVAGGPQTLSTASFINGADLLAGEVFDVSPGSTDEDTPGTYEGLVVDVTSGSSAGQITIELDIGKIRPGPVAGGASLDCSYSPNADSGYEAGVSAGTFVRPTITVDVLGPSVSVDAVNEVVAGSGTGQSVTTHARPGVNQILLDGAGFAASTALTAEICDVGAPAGDLSCVSAGGGATDTGGAYNDVVVVVDAAEPPGARDIVVSDGSDSAATTITILGTRTISVSPNPGSLSAPLTISGANWDPNETIPVLGSSTSSIGVGVTPTGDSGTANSDVNGNLGGTITLTDPATAFLVAQEADFNPGLGIFSAAETAWAAAANNCVADPSCSIDQTVILQIDPGQLSQSFVDGTIDLGTEQLDGLNDIPVSANINQITVVDARGTSEGWTLNGTISDLTNQTAPAAGDNVLEGADIGIIPLGCANVTGAGTDGAPGAPASGTATLCVVASGVGNGSWTVDALLGVTIPVSQNAGAYQGTFTTTLS